MVDFSMRLRVHGVLVRVIRQGEHAVQLGSSHTEKPRL